ncbi:hypothetical protein ABZ383_31110 [Streptomyces sp. NPDC005900]|uniref:hypothetical protein n=1 Tax=Streptomyces sp. NPDC005900 TaxID=3154569 RepID=UPI0033D2C040
MIERRPVTNALQTLLATLTGYPVGKATVPLDTAGKPVPPPYTLLYSLDDTDADGTLADNNKAAIFDYQATFVSGPVPGQANSRGGLDQAEWLADRARRVLDRPADGSGGYLHPLTVPGVRCYHREARAAGGTSDPGDAIITTVIRFRLHLETST